MNVKEQYRSPWLSSRGQSPGLSAAAPIFVLPPKRNAALAIRRVDEDGQIQEVLLPKIISPKKELTELRPIRSETPLHRQTMAPDATATAPIMPLQAKVDDDVAEIKKKFFESVMAKRASDPVSTSSPKAAGKPSHGSGYVLPQGQFFTEALWREQKYCSDKDIDQYRMNAAQLKDVPKKLHENEIPTHAVLSNNFARSLAQRREAEAGKTAKVDGQANFQKRGIMPTNRKKPLKEKPAAAGINKDNSNTKTQKGLDKKRVVAKKTTQTSKVSTVDPAFTTRNSMVNVDGIYYDMETLQAVKEDLPTGWRSPSVNTNQEGQKLQQKTNGQKRGTDKSHIKSMTRTPQGTRGHSRTNSANSNANHQSKSPKREFRALQPLTTVPRSVAPRQEQRYVVEPERDNSPVQNNITFEDKTHSQHGTETKPVNSTLETQESSNMISDSIQGSHPATDSLEPSLLTKAIEQITEDSQTGSFPTNESSQPSSLSATYDDDSDVDSDEEDGGATLF